MPRWKFQIYARHVGAIGTCTRYTVERNGETCEKAKLALYDEFEHITVEYAQLLPATTTTNKDI